MPAVADDKLARVTCGGCHAFPPPDILPRDRWRDEFVRMHFIRENRLPPIGPPDKVYPTVQLPPDMTAVLAFYQAQAPERLPAPESWPAPGDTPIGFERRTLAMADMPPTPAVSSLSIEDVDGDGRLDLLGTDMRQGVVFTAPLKGGDVVGASPAFRTRRTLLLQTSTATASTTSSSATWARSFRRTTRRAP